LCARRARNLNVPGSDFHHVAQLHFPFLRLIEHKLADSELFVGDVVDWKKILFGSGSGAPTTRGISAWSRSATKAIVSCSGL
jgi:hypothetical protein